MKLPISQFKEFFASSVLWFLRKKDPMKIQQKVGNRSKKGFVRILPKKTICT